MKVLTICGPTCVGKTGVTIVLAQRLNAEIVSADSMQVYKGMDIGTAKPTADQRSLVAHHMIDIAGPTDTYSTGRYVSDAALIMEDITARGKRPIVSGGTGLYIRAMSKGLFSAPSADWELRNNLMSAEAQTPGFLYNYLGSIDPKSAEKINPNDHRRVIRAIEVCLKCGTTMSKLQMEMTRPLPYEFIKICLTRQRDELYAMINERVDMMLASGLVEEAETLFRLPLAHTPMQAIGYKELFAYFRGETGLAEAVLKIKQATRRYAKRQICWFKSEPDILCLDITGISDEKEILHKIIPHLPI
ncbi:tRNA (adenosine(37)-N6)-dimethylallyltransferase MiaA [Candidatus Magnetominusculus xianensis]|uniref:tRNA dimethylallyltransferase n=1 Tax=Candidatus Magnetominusculus xianensis TaxID=1748249 RepID=A0ABR5SJY2_9BACT|nr:tRNA (adenosine(37)-N6)-dimethylallyltransferase MiaA [Candidatus Magnetominusculus xianensis]KWT92835.1 tRNA delta(2)-isopentenylpyrophosphate transferase [Candidatus Magnetominusculus xianensis]MBF0403424.1 tRNA (adenosine(37)-N6)-dimethylallyltransferase MiaA [Nitrospirota bacterium]